MPNLLQPGYTSSNKVSLHPARPHLLQQDHTSFSKATPPPTRAHLTQQGHTSSKEVSSPIFLTLLQQFHFLVTKLSNI
jgi:hypothetical protein